MYSRKEKCHLVTSNGWLLDDGAVFLSNTRFISNLHFWGVFVVTESTYNAICETVKTISKLLNTILDGITGILSSFNNCLAENRKRRHQKRDKTRKEISELRNKEIQEHIKKIQENPNNDTFIDIPHI
uniref:Uncharacterized protein n=1 Tax=Strongyloides papillosus TaxID=174720 RepID=A0A0N5C514_STREA